MEKSAILITESIQIPEEASEKGKKAWANFKREVWHEVMSVISKPLQPLTKFGLAVVCGDMALRRFRLFLNILAGDYEEQYVLSSILLFFNID